MKIKTEQEIIERIKEITKDIGLVCLIPKTGNSGVTCHEHTLCDHEVKELLWKIYSQAQSDLLESAGESMKEFLDNQNILDPGQKYRSKREEEFCIGFDKGYREAIEDVWKRNELHHAKLIKEKDEMIHFLRSRHEDISNIKKDERIKELETQLGLSKREKLVAINSLNELNRHLSNEEHVDSSWIKDVIEIQSSSYIETLKERKKYQVAVKDIEWLLRESEYHHFVDCSSISHDDDQDFCDCKDGKFKAIKSKYGLDKQESKE